MKLQIIKTFQLAQPEPWKPHWRFTKDQILETDNEYLIDRLLVLGYAKVVGKRGPKTAKEETRKEHKTPKNKAHITPKTK